MNGREENRFRVSGRIAIDYKLISQAINVEYAGYFTFDNDLNKWLEVDSECQVTEISRSHLLKMIEGQQQDSLNSVSSAE